MALRTLYIIYNADASVMGKINYGYRKLTAPKDKPACAACDITHGGLHLDETAEWKKAKEDVAREAENVTLKQLHRDQMGGEIKQFIDINKYRYPMVLMGEGQDYKLVMDNNELTACNGNALQFVQKLRENGAFGSSSTSSL